MKHLAPSSIFDFEFLSAVRLFSAKIVVLLPTSENRCYDFRVFSVFAKMKMVTCLLTIFFKFSMSVKTTSPNSFILSNKTINSLIQPILPLNCSGQNTQINLITCRNSELMAGSQYPQTTRSLLKTGLQLLIELLLFLFSR